MTDMATRDQVGATSTPDLTMVVDLLVAPAVRHSTRV